MRGLVFPRFERPLALERLADRLLGVGARPLALKPDHVLNRFAEHKGLHRKLLMQVGAREKRRAYEV